MSKWITTTVLIIVCAFGLHFIFPWWCIVIPCFLLAAWSKLGLAKSFFAGFIGIAVLWGIYSIYKDLGNDGIMSEVVAGIFSLNSGALMILITAILGGLIGGMAATAGSSLRRIFA